MNRDSAYHSSIPEEAREKITARQADGSRRIAEYYLGKERVGVRLFHRDGTLQSEEAFRNGVLHGRTYRWDTPGELLSVEPYEDGVQHGTAYQWGHDGRLIGSYTMEHGTGIDLWRQDRDDGTIDLREVHYYIEGRRHGFEWWFCERDRLSRERHWIRDELHGIEREWSFEGKLRRGFPRYWVRGEQKTKAQYLRAAAQDPELPPFRPEENLPNRTFPPEIDRHLRHV
jgi:antitoxin component YwqK of YwqJK toxin-antitoxin module